MQLWPNGPEIVPLYAFVSKFGRTLSPFHGLEDTPAWKYQILGVREAIIPHKQLLLHPRKRIQASVFLLEAMPMVAESNGTESVCDAEVVEEIVEKTTVTDSKVISEETNPGNEPSTVSAASASSTYQQGIDDFYQSLAESQKRKLDTIHEYLLYIMSPFVYEEDMDEFCTDLLRFAMDHNYRPEVEWNRYKTKLSSFDVRHLVWSIAIRLGLGKGKVYSNDDCACYIERRFASLCVTASGEPLSHSTLRNLTVTSNSDQIHCDIQGADGLLCHIPSQLGIEKDRR